MAAVSAYAGSINEKEKDLPEQVEHVHDKNLGYINEAIHAEEQEHIGVLAAFKLHPKATFWSFCVSCVIIMEAYDAALIGNLMAQPAFARQFGKLAGDGTYQVEPAWQGACNNASTIGAFIGILVCGYVQPIFGYKKVILASLVMIIAAIFIPFFAESIEAMFIGQLVVGFPFGFYNAIAQAYASEIAPLPLRGIFTMYNQMCWCTGQFITAGILFAFRNGTDKWAYKIPFAIQWAWPVPLIAVLVFAPESPWWYVRKGRLEEAERVIKRLESSRSGRNPAEIVAMMQRTIEIEDRVTEGASYKAVFQGIDLKRTITASILFAAQTWSGLLIGNNATYFFTVAGMDADKAFQLSLGNTAIQWVAVVLAFWATAYVGRRTLYLSGVSFQALMLLVIGIAASASGSSASFWVQATFLMLVYFSYGLTVGPITFSLVAEISSVKLRAQTCAIARATYYAVSVGMQYINSYALNPLAWNLKGQTAFIWLGTAIGVIVFTWFMVPETKDRSYRELDVLYHRGVSPRHFKRTKVEATDDE